MLDANNWVKKIKTSPGWESFSREISKVLAKTAESALPLRLYQAPNWVSSVVCQRVLFGAHDGQSWQEHTKHDPQGSPVDTLRPPAAAWRLGRDTNNRVISVPSFPDPSCLSSHCMKRNRSCNQATPDSFHS